MPTATIVPTNVRDRTSHAGGDIVLTGDPDTMWGDGSDSTNAYRAVSNPGNSIMLADVAPWSGGTITAASATMRILLDAGNADQRVDFWTSVLGSQTPAGDSGPLAGFSGADPSGTDPTAPLGVAATLSGLYLMDNASGDPKTPEQLNTLFKTGFGLGVSRRPVSGSAALTVYELTFEITYTLATPPPLRRYPRPGATGPTRHWPRTITRRPGTY